MKKSFTFILINILISAATTLIVLLVWELTHKSALPVDDQQTVETIQMPIEECIGSLPTADETVISIENVVGKGDLQKEEVDILYTGSESFCFNGWELIDQHGNQYDFPKFFQVYSQGITIKVYTRPGTDTPLELYWGNAKALWRSGETVRMVDPSGNVQATYRIP